MSCTALTLYQFTLTTFSHTFVQVDPGGGVAPENDPCHEHAVVPLLRFVATTTCLPEVAFVGLGINVQVFLYDPPDTGVGEVHADEGDTFTHCPGVGVGKAFPASI